MSSSENCSSLRAKSAPVCDDAPRSLIWTPERHTSNWAEGFVPDRLVLEGEHMKRSSCHRRSSTNAALAAAISLGALSAPPALADGGRGGDSPSAFGTGGAGGTG